MHRMLLPLLLLLTLPSQLLAQQPPAPAVKVGDAAPAFTLRYLAATGDEKFAERSVSLSDFKGKKAVILAFFPAAFSPG